RSRRPDTLILGGPRSGSRSMPMPSGAEKERKGAPRLLHCLSVGREGRFLPYAVPVSVLALTLVSFLPSLQSGFVRWSDYETLVQNPYYRGLTWHHLYWMFTTFHLGNYRPLTWVTFAVDYTFWGMNPFGYHLTSLLLHGVNSILVYFIAVRLLSLAFLVSAASASAHLKVAGGLAALLFSVHPLRCEPVLWLSGRGHLLTALFFLLTIVCYLRAAESQE